MLLLDVAGAIVFAGVLAWLVALAASGGLSAIPALAGALGLIAGGLVRALALVGSEVVVTRSARKTIAGLRSRLLPFLLGGRLAAPIIPGAAATIALDDLEALRMREIRYAPARLAAVVGPVLILLAIAFSSLIAAGILMLTFFFFTLTMVLTGSAAARESNAQLEALTTLSALLADRLQHLPIIRQFGAEERISRQIGRSSRELSDRTLAVLRKAFLSSAALEFFAALAVALVAVYCGFSLLGLLPFPDPENLTLAEAFFALALAPEFYLPMRRLAAAYHEKQLGEAAQNIVDPLLGEAKLPRQASAAFAGLEVEDLSIQFDERTIGPLSFSIGQTGMIALAGASGSGKSTVLAATAGQIIPASGHIVTAGTNCPPAPNSIAWAAQKPLLLPGTLYQNLVLAAPDATRDEVEQVAQDVGLGAVIERRGIDLKFDSRGAGLSGGERRRIGIARAVLSGRRLILFDEPTADLDAQSAGEIAKLLQRLSHTHALLIATHDPMLVAMSDKVILL